MRLTFTSSADATNYRPVPNRSCRIFWRKGFDMAIQDLTPQLRTRLQRVEKIVGVVAVRVDEDDRAVMILDLVENLIFQKRRLAKTRFAANVSMQIFHRFFQRTLPISPPLKVYRQTVCLRYLTQTHGGSMR